eukprot:2736148-Rhodomonas_salina.1
MPGCCFRSTCTHNSHVNTRSRTIHPTQDPTQDIPPTQDKTRVAGADRVDLGLVGVEDHEGLRLRRGHRELLLLASAAGPVAADAEAVLGAHRDLERRDLHVRDVARRVRERRLQLLRQLLLHCRPVLVARLPHHTPRQLSSSLRRACQRNSTPKRAQRNSMELRQAANLAAGERELCVPGGHVLLRLPEGGAEHRLLVRREARRALLTPTCTRQLGHTHRHRSTDKTDQLWHTLCVSLTPAPEGEHLASKGGGILGLGGAGAAGGAAGEELAGDGAAAAAPLLVE